MVFVGEIFARSCATGQIQYNKTKLFAACSRKYANFTEIIFTTDKNLSKTFVVKYEVSKNRK
jgi:hypothetical protein